MSLRIDHGTIITMDADRRIIRDGAVLIEGNTTRAVGQTAAVGTSGAVEKIIDARGKIVLPGLVDTHVHNEQTLARGLGDDVDVNVWTYQRIWPYETLLTEDDAYLSALVSCIEMIRTGTTCCADPGGYQPDAVGRALRDTGMRGIVAWAAIDLAPPGFTPPPGLRGFMRTDAALRRMEEVVHRWNGQADGRIRAAYSLRTDVNISEDLFRETKKLADRDGALIEMHLSTHEARVEAFRQRHGGSTTVEFMHKTGVLGPSWLLIHAPYVTEAEVRLLRDHDAKISHNVGASLHGMYGACSRGKFPEMLDLGVTVGLGCDSTAANNSLDMFRAMYLAATVHKEMRMVPDLIRPEKALEMATIDAARAIGWDDEIGSLEVGKRADVIIVDPSGANWIPVHDFSLVPNLVYAGDGRDVETTIIDGVVVMENRVIKTIDMSQALAQAQAAAERIVAQLPYRSALQSPWRFC